MNHSFSKNWTGLRKGGSGKANNNKTPRTSRLQMLSSFSKKHIIIHTSIIILVLQLLHVCLTLNKYIYVPSLSKHRAVLNPTTTISRALNHYLDNHEDLHDHTSNLAPQHQEAENDQPKWLKLTPEEMQSYLQGTNNNTACNSPFQHCCIGQCRQSYNKIPVGEALWKWNEDRPGARPLAKLSHVLDYLEKRKTSSESSCKLSFYGHSLSADTVMGAVCELIQSGYKLKSCNPQKLGASQVGEDVGVQCERNNELDASVAHFMLESDSTTTSSCQRIVIALVHVLDPLRQQKKVSDAMTELQRYTNDDDGFVHVYNWGVHCNAKNTKCLKINLERTLIPYVKSEKFKNFTFLFREHEPQHYNNDIGGVFDFAKKAERRDQTCGDVSSKERGKEVDNWRNEEAIETLAAHNLTKMVPRIRLFDDLVPLWQLHAGGGDCTHYCYNPLRLDLTWDRLLSALKEYDNYQGKYYY